MTKYLIAAALLALAAYGLLEAWPLIAGPRLSIESPADQATIEGGIVEIRGRAPRAADLTLNGAILFHEENGAFLSTLTFPRGTSILTFVAADRFGRSVRETRTIFVP